MRFTYSSGSRPLDGYTIKRGVGRGGFGEVYFAVSDAGKEVALKLIRRNLDVELRGVTQCLNLKHQNLVALYDIRTDEHEDRWVVMEYVSGQSLEDAIDAHPAGMQVDSAMRWFEGIASGVAYLHDHGIVHRDLKPANIFIDEGSIKIGDYGLSKFISCSRRSGQTESVGTVHYMAPEIANGRYGKEIDTYALGIILYEMLTGHVPFEGESVGEVLMKHLTAEPELNVLDEPYRSIVQGAMAKDPDVRIKNVSDMLARLPQNGFSAKFSASSTEPSPVATVAMPSKGQAKASASSDEEPILAGIREGFRQLERDSNVRQWHPLLKTTALVLGAIGLVATSVEWLPVAIVLGISYLVYRAIRAIIVQPGTSHQTAPSPSSVPPQPLESQHSSSEALPDSGQNRRHRTRRPYSYSWQQQLSRHVAAKPLRERTTELIGGMLVAAVVAAIASLLVFLIPTPSMQLELYVWVTLVAILACWAIMIPAKLAEGKIEDQAPLRFIQLVLGVLLGVAAWGLAEGLMLSLPIGEMGPPSPGESVMGEVLGWDAYGNRQAWRSGTAPLPIQICVAYFAFLFVIIRWWRQAEFMRTSRLSLWAIFACGLTAYVLHFFCWFPQPLGFLVAGIVALTVQLSSPWMPPSRRRTLSEVGV